MNSATPSFTTCHVLVSLETSFNTSADADITCISSVYHLYILYLDQTNHPKKSCISTAFQAFNRTGNSNDLAMFFWEAVIVPSHRSPWSKLCKLGHRKMYFPIFPQFISVWLQQSWNLQTLHANIAMMPRLLRGSQGWQGTAAATVTPVAAIHISMFKNMRPAWIFEWNIVKHIPQKQIMIDRTLIDLRDHKNFPDITASPPRALTFGLWLLVWFWAKKKQHKQHASDFDSRYAMCKSKND